MIWKTYSISWDEWKELCDKNDIDPYENVDLSFETGGGDGYTVRCSDDPPEREDE